MITYFYKYMRNKHTLIKITTINKNSEQSET